MPLKNTHCSHCGARFELDLEAVPEFPAICRNCEKVTYVNPLPVVLAVIPIEERGTGPNGIPHVRNHILMIERGIEPQSGKLALPGGYIELGETWQEALAREVKEEARLTIDPDSFRILDVKNGSTTVLIFAETDPLKREDLPPFTATNETTDRAYVSKAVPTLTAFEAHNQVVSRWFAQNGSYREL